MCVFRCLTATKIRKQNHQHLVPPVQILLFFCKSDSVILLQMDLIINVQFMYDKNLQFLAIFFRSKNVSVDHSRKI